MLKDLEQRNGEQQNVQGQYVPNIPTQPSKKPIVLLVIAIIVLNILGLTIWYLYSENEALKQPKEQTSSNVEQQSPSKPQAVQHSNNNAQQAPVESTTLAVTPVEKAILAPTPELKSVAKVSNDKLASKVVSSAQVKDQQPNRDDKISAENLSLDKKSPSNTTSQSTPLVNKAKIAATKNSSMSVSRRQLSSDELAKQKMVQAEKALTQKNVVKAETLYEDILLLQPENSTVRKKLAALWFGRKAYQPAVNLLSQGIALDPIDAELRLMQARVYLTDNNLRAALFSLKGFSGQTTQEYQALLASVAQELAEYDTAISTYKSLIELAPTSGKWWLGLAVAYDSKAEYSLAKQAYSASLNLGDLTKASADFATQRLQELGE